MSIGVEKVVFLSICQPSSLKFCIFVCGCHLAARPTPSFIPSLSLYPPIYLSIPMSDPAPPLITQSGSTEGVPSVTSTNTTSFPSSSSSPTSTEGASLSHLSQAISQQTSLGGIDLKPKPLTITPFNNETQRDIKKEKEETAAATAAMQQLASSAASMANASSNSTSMQVERQRGDSTSTTTSTTTITTPERKRSRQMSEKKKRSHTVDDSTTAYLSKKRWKKSDLEADGEQSTQEPSIYMLAASFTTRRATMHRTAEYFYSAYSVRRRIPLSAQPHLEPPLPLTDACTTNLAPIKKRSNVDQLDQLPRYSLDNIRKGYKQRYRRLKAWYQSRKKHRIARYSHRLQSILNPSNMGFQQQQQQQQTGQITPNSMMGSGIPATSPARPQYQQQQTWPAVK